jgi:hypothetical protein
MARENSAMRRLLLSAVLLLATASTAAAQSSSAAASSNAPSSSSNAGYPAGTTLGIGNGTLLNGLTAPNAAVSLSGNPSAACSADTSCASFPLTPLGAASPSLTPRLSPMIIGTQANQAGTALTSPTISGTFNATSGLNPGGGLGPSAGALASPGIGAMLGQTSGLAPSDGLDRVSNPATTTPAAPTGGTPAISSTGTPASRPPAMSNSGFQSQCANSTSCSALQ